MEMDVYQQYIYKSRYARFLPEKKRREHWPETVDRYLSFVTESVKERHGYELPKETVGELREAIVNLEVMPSMRAMMVSGKAAARDNSSLFNCTYTVVDDPKAFDEAMHLLMCGCGVGFSVERQYVNQLPEIPEKLFDSDTTIVVKDSKEGWSKALRQLIALLYSGEIPKWNIKLVRPAGSVLKTFGGRASGPEPLEDLFRFVVKIFKNARGRKLTSIECHDIMCKIGEVVVVGGVRRSAMISLSNLSDDRMRHAKNGAWWEANVQRALSNNSAVYTEKPDIGIFMQEWLALYESKSGERGIFNRQASRNIIKSHGRRNPDHEWGTNPSLAKGTKVFTTKGIFSIEELEGRDFFVNTLDKSVAPAKCFLSSPSAKLYEVVLPGNISYFATAQHKWPVVRSGKKLRLQTTELKPGDYIPSNHKKDVLPFGTLGSYDDGFLIGWNLGDGWITRTSKGDKTQYGWGIYGSLDRESGIHEKIHHILNKYTKTNVLLNGAPGVNLSGETLNKLFEEHGVSHKSNGLPLSVWKEASEEFRKGLVDGLISSDGHVNTGGGIDFVSVHEKLIDDLASLLGCYGIKVRKKIRKIPETDIIIKGKNVKNVRQSYSIHIKDIMSINHFANIFSLSRNDKQARLDGNKNLTHKHSNIQSSHWKIKDILETNRTEPVWDITVNHEDHSFELDHCQTGNCSEIILRPNQMCNLSEVVVRSTDDGEKLKRKVKLATILGTLQSTFTYFPYLRKVWKKNIEEERLLGVSLTGIYDHHILGNYKNDNLPSFLEELRNVAIETNKTLAAEIGIEPSAAVTAVKPSGCTTLDTKIKTTEGIMSMAEIFSKYSDQNIFEVPAGTWLDLIKEIEVYDEYGTKQKVSKLFVNGMSEVYEIEDVLGNVYKFTGNHKLKTTNGWKRVDELVENDEIMSL